MNVNDRVRLLKKRGPCPAGSEGVIANADDPDYVDIDIDRRPSPPCTEVDPPFPLLAVPVSMVTTDTRCT